MTFRSALTLLVVALCFTLSFSQVVRQPFSSTGVNPGCFNGATQTIVYAVDNECSALNNFTGLQTYCDRGSTNRFILNNANGVQYLVSCPPGNGVDDATGIYALPGGTIRIQAFTRFTPSQFNNSVVNDFWCSGFRSHILGGNITGGNCVAGVNSQLGCTNNGSPAPPASGDFRTFTVSGATADMYCSFAGGEDHSLLPPHFDPVYSTLLNFSALYNFPAYNYPQGALVYRIGETNRPGGADYAPLYTGNNVGEGRRLSTGVAFPGYPGGNTPFVNPTSTAANSLVRDITVPVGSSGYLYLCFWDYFNADNFGNVHVQVTYTPPRNSSICGVRGDPQFVGLRGQSYQVHGIDGAVYNLISDKDIQVNSRFTYLASGACPIKADGSRATNCWSHPGSYLGEISIQQRIGDELHTVRLVAGPANQGFASVIYGGVPLSVGAVSYVTVDGQQVGNVAFSVSVVDSHTVQVVTPKFTFQFESSDMFINQEIRVNVRSLQSHGLIGQTWSSKTYNNELKYIQGEIDDYLLPSGEMDGTDFLYNKF